MKYLFAAAMLASAVVGFSEAASAAEGCGRGFYRGAYGHCRPMRGAVVVRPAPVVVAPPVVVVPRARMPLWLPLVRRPLPPVLISPVRIARWPRGTARAAIFFLIARHRIVSGANPNRNGDRNCGPR
jgi:hypothetical protein